MEKIQAKRIPVVDHEQQFPRSPGEYMGPKCKFKTAAYLCIDGGEQPLAREVYFIPPGGKAGLCRVTEGHWTFKEEDDGSLTIRQKLTVSDKWNGFLKKGMWEEI